MSIRSNSCRSAQTPADPTDSTQFPGHCPGLPEETSRLDWADNSFYVTTFFRREIKFDAHN